VSGGFSWSGTRHATQLVLALHVLDSLVCFARFDQARANKGAMTSFGSVIDTVKDQITKKGGKGDAGGIKFK
jgi:hypothetical protein